MDAKPIMVFQATARSGINIALVKYWGKRDTEANWPAVGSISLTLDTLDTTTTVHFDHGLSQDLFSLNGVAMDDSRVTQALDRIRAVAGLECPARVTSINRVPTASGLASSASGAAALALAGWQAAGLPTDRLTERDDFLDIVRRGSGSAPRSLLGGIVELDRDTGRLTCLCEPENWPLRIVVTRLSNNRKAVSSRDGMAHTRTTSAYYAEWVKRHPLDLAEARRAIARRDLAQLGAVMERSTMRMHAAMLASDPPLRYWKGKTLEVIDVVEQLRRDGVSAWYTMDAGPHVKVLCHADDQSAVVTALSQLVPTDDVIVAHPGPGAQLVGP